MSEHADITPLGPSFAWYSRYRVEGERRGLEAAILGASIVTDVDVVTMAFVVEITTPRGYTRVVADPVEDSGRTRRSMLTALHLAGGLAARQG